MEVISQARSTQEEDSRKIDFEKSYVFIHSTNIFQIPTKCRYLTQIIQALTVYAEPSMSHFILYSQKLLFRKDHNFPIFQIMKFGTKM